MDFFFATLVQYLLWFKIFPCGNNKIVMTFLKATDNTNGKQVLKSTELELSVSISMHTYSLLSGPNAIRWTPPYMWFKISQRALYSLISKTHRFQSKFHVFFSQKVSVKFPVKTSKVHKAFLIFHPKKETILSPPSLSNPFVLKFTQRRGTNTPVP